MVIVVTFGDTMPRIHLHSIKGKSLRVSEAQEVLSAYLLTPPSKQTILNWIEDGSLHGTKFNGCYYITAESLAHVVSQVCPQLKEAA